MNWPAIGKLHSSKPLLKKKKPGSRPDGWRCGFEKPAITLFFPQASKAAMEGIVCRDIFSNWSFRFYKMEARRDIASTNR